MLVLVVVSLPGQTASAGPPVAKAVDSSVRPVDGEAAYSTGSTGHKLKWLPHRPSRSEVAPRVIAAQHVAEVPPVKATPPREATPPRDAGTAPRERWAKADPLRRSEAFADPFGDRRPGLPPPAAQSAGVARDPIEIRGPATPLLPPASPDASLDYTFSSAEPTLPGVADNVAPAPPRRSAVIGRPLMRSNVRLKDDCAAAKEDFKEVSQLNADITASDGSFPPECDLGQKIYEPRAWSSSTYAWTASGLCHKPVYFEDVHLERYGHSWGPYLQPVISGGRFFLTVPILPYKMGLKPPGECVYTLGHYRPGNCAPYLLDPLPLSVRAAVAQAGALTGMAYVLP